MRSFPPPEHVVREVIDWLYEVPGQEVLAGFNVNFDQRMLWAWMSHLGFQLEYVDNVAINSTHIDVLKMVFAAAKKKLITTKARSLEGLCKHYKIATTKSHDALSDSIAALELYLIVKALLPDYENKPLPVVTNDELRWITNDGKYLMINAEGSVYISEHLTANTDLLYKVLDKIKDIYKKPSE
jgi:DNA polymerase III epsilon subunit-like protein